MSMKMIGLHPTSKQLLAEISLQDIAIAVGWFGPGDFVTVAEVLKMAMRSAGIDEHTCSGEPTMSQARTHWARPFVVCGEQRGVRLLEAWPDLDHPALRGEVLTIIHDAFDDDVLPLVSPFHDTVGHPYEADIAFAAVLGVVSGDSDKQGNPIGTFRPNQGVVRAEMAKMIFEKLKVTVADEKLHSD